MKTRGRSLQRQVMIAVFAAITFSLALSGIGLGIVEYRAAETRLYSTLEALAEVSLGTTVPAVDFGVPEAAAEALANLGASTAIRRAELWHYPDGERPVPFAQFARADAQPQPDPLDLSDGRFTRGHRALLVRTFGRDGGPVATLRLEGDLSSARRSFGESLQSLAAIFAVLLLIGAGLSHVLQRAITARIRALAGIAERVRDTEDYSLRANDAAADEIGRLAQQFNLMLAGIEDRDRRLAESGAFQRAILHSTAVGIISTDPSGVVRTFNPAAERLTGISAAEAVGRLTPVEWHDKLELQRRALELSAATGAPVPAGIAVLLHEANAPGRAGREWTLVHRSGRLIPVFLTVSELRRQDGELLGYCGLATDLTERHTARLALVESEARFRRLTENAPDVIFRYRLDTEGIRCEFINSAVQRIAGYLPEEFYHHRLLPLRIVHPDDRPIIKSIISRREIPSKAAEIRWMTRDGRTITTEQRFVPVLNPAGRLVAFEGIARDITEVKLEADRNRQLELQLHHAQKMQSIGTLAGGIAHDFNNILTGILGFTEIALLSLEKRHPATESLEEVRLAGRRARDLVAQILTFSRPQEVQRAPLDLARAAAETLKLLRASAPASIKIERQFETGAVAANPTQIHQVVLNLCTNAVHAIGDQPGVLRVEVKRVEVDENLALRMPKIAPGHYVRLSVIDTGRGMSPSTMSRVFDPFFTTKKSGEGTGIGLSVVQGIVTSHQGGITVDSVEGQGSTFSVYLPAIDYLAEDTLATTPPAPGRSERVLVVDDERSLAEFVGVRLQHYNYRVAVFDNPQQALATVCSGATNFEALVTDLTMPGLSGLELIQRIRATGHRLPAVIVTGNRDSLRDSHLPALAIVEKPFTGEDVARALRRLLDETSAPPV